MGDGEYWSIGEVLSLLQDEFPEITISKIRFLESQGLIEPERTPSGYRRFYQSDFDLLQWILIQQRDHYLPLKVIRDRIKSGDTEQGLLDFSGANGDHPPASTRAEAEPSPGGEVAPKRPSPVAPDVVPLSSESAVATNANATSGAEPDAGATSPVEVSGDNGETDPTTESAAADAAPMAPSIADESDAGEPTVVVDEPVAPLALTRDELSESSGCSVKMLADLERYGLVKGRKAGPTVLYDNTALLIARIAAQFAAFGLEPRHLRTFLIGAEREMGLVHQVVEPMLHRRDAETRRKAHETLDDLTDLAGSLRSILMRQAAEELLPKH
ncbi:MAG: MerR family transcriptional regulator [Acidimicrobiales bacterium]